MHPERHKPQRLVQGLGLFGAGLALALSGELQARDPLYGVISHEPLQACEQEYWHGSRPEAAVCYRDLVRDLVLPPAIRAEAMWALGDVRSANSLFQTAVESAPEDADVRVRWGDLFLQTYQYQEALNLYEEALNLHPEHAYAHIGAAQALVEGGSGEGVNEHMSQVMDSLSSPPGARLRGRLLLIARALENDEHGEARQQLDEARELAQDNDLPTMEISALEAAHAFVTRGDPTPFIEAALQESPAYGDAYAIPAYFASITRRYKEAGELYAKAVEVQPDHWEAHLALGQNHLRLNQVTDAIEHIELSYDGDPFNPRAVNLLRLLDTFTEDFVTVSYPDPPQDGIPDLTLRLHRDERDILKDYARQLAEDSIALYSDRYGFEPREPIIIEIYPNHEDFVVRSIGMPGVGILGVTFGYLFAMDSPSGHPDESYHWGTTLWHEMAHVFTLEASDHFVPRWFSEGISVFEEWRTGPIPGRKIPTGVLQAMAQGKFLPISELDDGFMRPTYDNQVMVSYMQAGLVFEFIDLEYGFDRIVDILHQFRDGTTADQAIENSLGISVADFDRHFKQFIDIEYGELLGSLGTWMQDHKASYQALQAGDWEEATAAAQRAIFLYPDYVDVDSPYIVKAQAHARLDQQEERFASLETFWQRGGYAPRALLPLADHYLETGRLEQAERVMMDINYADPFNETLHTKLGDLYMETGRPRMALREFEVLQALDPIDKAAAYYRLARAHHALGDGEATMQHLMTALDIAPQYRPAQQLLLDISRQNN